MAYQSKYNPDALPAHAEPEQAAQMLSSHQAPPRLSSRPHASSQPGHYSSNEQSYAPPNYNKPQPPMPAPVQQLQSQTSGSYGRGSNNGYASPSHSYSVDSVPRYSSAGPGPSPPPPQNYVYGAPPPQRYTTTSPHAVDSRIPPSPQPWANEGTQPSLFPLFKAVDKMGTGQLTEKELKTALVNGDYTSFDPHTVRMMIRMFDTDRSGTINYDEFCGLWGFLASWRSLFDRFDEDRSGNISYDEYSRALVAFGYRLSPQFVQLLFRSFDKRGENAISFDLFMQSCISLKRMTDVFKKYDDDRDGYITLSFEEFLTEILRQR